MSTLGIKDRRTLNVYLLELLKHGLLVYNPKSGYYFISSFERFRRAQQLKDRTSVILFFDKFSTIQSFIDTAVIGQLIRNQEYFWLNGKIKFRRPAIRKSDIANTAIQVDRSKKPAYFGLSNSTIAKNLNCSLSEACKKKHRAEKAGLIETKEHFLRIHTLDKADRNIRYQIYNSNPKLMNRLRFRTFKDLVSGRKKIELVQQLHDEIKPLILFSLRRRVKF